ncbi:sulfite exporter TauE/SafE family protein [Plastoroseomonas arctica]|uniref:Probable membrane transporter protein n=1 Tax=Plastoroseomonas arctica TaxID=1509237 RepID=A0AAF1JYE5_9PROT|nr:sulfite exporter TauE/SafE family protein [Plastoroseomonas arctica]MBR0654878.1 sulfite exporter TauE/SafE family protein [Plastoroseomonas arctica]
MDMLLPLALVFLLAGFVKGAIGLGLPTIGMALMTLLIAPAEAAALLLLPNIVTNLVQMRPWPETARLARRLWPMLLGVVLGTGLGALLWGGFGGRYGGAVLGLVLALYGTLGLLGVRIALPERAGLPVGVATGALTAATGVFVIPAVPWLQTLGLAKDALVRALALSFTVSTLALAVLLRAAGGLDGRLVAASALALLPALAGQALGTRMRGRLSEAAFKRVFFAAVVALGLAIELRA